MLRLASHKLPRSGLATNRWATTSRPWQFLTPPARDEQILLGCVAYDPSVGTIWDSMKSYFQGAGLLSFDYVLFTNYEAQVAALLNGLIDIAWNGPQAHVLVQHLSDGQCVSLGMRDIDRNFRTVCLVRKDAQASNIRDLAGLTVGTGASDSPQATVVPLHWLLQTMEIFPMEVRNFDVDLGKHGDTAAGEKAALAALVAGDVDAVMCSDMMYRRGLQGLLRGINSTILSSQVVQLKESPPTFDHCQFDAMKANWKTEAFTQALFKMDMGNPLHAPTMKLEGISKSWVPSREKGYKPVRDALQHRLPNRQPSAAFSTSAVTKNVDTSKPSKDFDQSSKTGSNNLAEKMKQAPTVGIVGGGVAGLQTARALMAKGFEVTVFESAAAVGGVWRENYLNFGIQVPKEFYEFTDLPMTEAARGEYASGTQVQEYIERYADVFNLRDVIELNAKVESIEQMSSPDSTGEIFGWEMTVNGQTRAFDKVVVCTGLYSAHNIRMPHSLDQLDNFHGAVMHSFNFRDPSQVSGKTVVVVGAGKSAIDAATECIKGGAKQVTLLSRQPHWPTPRKIANLVPFQYIFLSRLGQSLVVGLKGALPALSKPEVELWGRVAKWPMKGAFKLVELLFAAQFKNMVGPTSPLFKKCVVADFYGYAHVLDNEFRDMLADGRINWVIGEVCSIGVGSVNIRKVEDKQGVEGKDGSGDEQIDADVVIYATGFGKDYSLFDTATQAQLSPDSDGLYLFRHTVSAYGLQAAWLAKFWRNELVDQAKLCDRAQQETEVAAMKEWKRSWMPDTASRASLVLLHQVHFADRLLQDMGLPHRRKNNPIAEIFMPYESSDYDGVIGK